MWAHEKPGSWRASLGDLLGTIWHTTDRLAALALVACAGCGASSESSSRWARDAGADADGADASGDADASDASDAGGPFDHPSFDDDDLAPCGGGTVWEQILEPTATAASENLSPLSGYANGDMIVYRGTAAVRDNRGLVYTDAAGELSGDVVAKLRSNERHGELGPVLTVKALAEARYFEMYQPPTGGTTLISAVTSTSTTSAAVAEVEASASVPAFADAPREIAFDVVATGPEIDSGLALEVEAGVTLERVEPVSFTDLLALNFYGAGEEDETLEEFAESADGSEYVRTVTAGATIPACVPEGSGFAPGECNYLVSYSAEEYVAAGALETHGVRELEITHVLLDCYHCTRSEGFSDSYRCVEGLHTQRWP